MLYIQAVLFCEFVRAIYVHNSGNPYEYLNPNSDGDEITINEAAEYSDVKIVNISSLAGQSDGQILTNKKRNRVGFYNVQTGDEFFLNDFEVRPKFKTKQSNRHVLGYEYNSNKNSDKDGHGIVQVNLLHTLCKIIDYKSII